MNEPIRSLLLQLRSHVLSDIEGSLPLWGRLQLWKSMFLQFGDEASMRRSCMALYVCDALLTRWEKAGMPGNYHTLPRTLCELTRHFLGGVISKSGIDVLSNDYSVINEDCMCHCNWAVYGNIVFLYYGSRHLLFRAVDDDDDTYSKLQLYARCDSSEVTRRPTEDDFNEPSLWDTFYVASLVATDESQRQGTETEADSRRRFWLNWLDDVVPCFCGEISEARKLASVYLLRE